MKHQRKLALFLAIIGLSTLGRVFLPRVRGEVPHWAYDFSEGVLVFTFWISLALLVNYAIDRYLWPRLYGPAIPGQPRQRKLLMQLVHVTMVGVGIGLAMKQLLAPELGTMVAGSGVIAIVLGLALQNTLGDFFAGVALNIERPFKAGEWITLDDKTDGLVLSTNWRSTHIRTRTFDELIVPNSVIAKMRFTNRQHPAPMTVSAVTMRMMYGFDLELFKKIAEEAVLSVDGVLKTPPPITLIESFADWTVSVRVYFCLPDYSEQLIVQGQASNAVYAVIRSDERLNPYMPRPLSPLLQMQHGSPAVSTPPRPPVAQD